MNPTRRVSLLLIAILLVLQACDLFFTWRLLSGAHPDIYEANPLAAALLARFGWGSLALLKAGTTALILLAVLALWRRRPMVAERVLGGVCLVLVGVVGYSGWLLARPKDPLVQEIPQINARNAQLDRMIDNVARFAHKRQVICLDTLHGRTDLAVGVRRLRVCLVEEKPNLTSGMRWHLPALDRTDELAAFLYYHASRLVSDGLATEDHLGALERQMSRLYPRAPLWDYRYVSSQDPFPWGAGRSLVSVSVTGGAAN
jgi:hypothetical protein